MLLPFSTETTEAGLPPEEAEQKERVDQAFNEPISKLGSTEEGRAIQEALQDVGGYIARKLELFSHSIGTDRFTSRLYSLHRRGKGSNERWRTRHLHAAPTDSLMGDPDELRRLMQRYNEVEDAGHIHLWLCALQKSDVPRYLALFRHQSGLEALYMVSEGTWMPMSLSKAATDMSLQAALHADKDTRDRWVQLLSSSIRASQDGFKEALTPFLAQLGAAELTPDQWEELLRLVYLRREHWDQIAEAGRRMSTSALHEADYLLQVMLDYLQQTKQMYEARIERMEKDQQRSGKRLRTDFEKTQMALRSAEGRVKLLVKEISVLKQQRHTIPEPTQKDVSFNVALGQFFE